MGMNYYFIPKKKEINKVKELLNEKGYGILLDIGAFNNWDLDLHIGKSSAGWQFSFHKTPFFSTFEEFKRFYEINKKFYEIKDEDGEEILFEDLLKKIELKKGEKLNHAMEVMSGRCSFDDGSYLDEQGYSFSPSEFS